MIRHEKKPFKRFFSLSFKRKILYVEAFFFLLFWHVASKLLPLNWYKRFFGKRLIQSPEVTEKPPSEIALKISYTINISAQLAPWKPVCYPQALAARSMLRLRGLESVIFFGAADGEVDLPIKLHCWISHKGVILTGKPGHEDYQVIQIYS